MRTDLLSVYILVRITHKGMLVNKEATSKIVMTWARVNWELFMNSLKLKESFMYKSFLVLIDCVKMDEGKPLTLYLGKLIQ